MLLKTQHFRHKSLHHIVFPFVYVLSSSVHLFVCFFVSSHTSCPQPASIPFCLSLIPQSADLNIGKPNYQAMTWLLFLSHSFSLVFSPSLSLYFSLLFFLFLHLFIALFHSLFFPSARLKNFNTNKFKKSLTFDRCGWVCSPASLDNSFSTCNKRIGITIKALKTFYDCYCLVWGRASTWFGALIIYIFISKTHSVVFRPAMVLILLRERITWYNVIACTGKCLAVRIFFWDVWTMICNCFLCLKVVHLFCLCYIFLKWLWQEPHFFCIELYYICIILVFFPIVAAWVQHGWRCTEDREDPSTLRK